MTRTNWLLWVSIASAALAFFGFVIGSAIRSGDWGDILGCLAAVAFLVGFVWCIILDARDMQREPGKSKKGHDL